MATLYVVCGSCDCGDFTGHWLVRAFRDRGQAEALKGRLEAWCKEHGFEGGREEDLKRRAEYEKVAERWPFPGAGCKGPPEDELFIWPDYGGIGYEVEEVELA
jgi:hypothetical protein